MEERTPSVADWSELRPLVEAYLDHWGEPALRLALSCGHLFYGVRPHSAFALHQSAEAYDRGIDTSLLISLSPATRRRGERSEVSLTIGGQRPLVGLGERLSE